VTAPSTTSSRSVVTTVRCSSTAPRSTSDAASKTPAMIASPSVGYNEPDAASRLDLLAPNFSENFIIGLEYRTKLYTMIGPLCHALSLSSLWTSHAACDIAIAGVRLATPGDWQCNGGSQYGPNIFSNASCFSVAFCLRVIVRIGLDQVYRHCTLFPSFVYSFATAHFSLGSFFQGIFVF